MIWCVVPLGREHLLPEVLRLFDAQRHRDARMILVRDGEGATEELGRAQVVYSGAHGISEALNAGLRVARSKGSPGDWFCKWDDDDYYGPGYLLTIAEAAARGATMAGRSQLWMRTSDGRIWFLDGPRGWSGIPHGSTLAARLDCADFTHVERCGEDTLWVVEMLRSGARYWAGAPGGCCWNRSAAAGHHHAWPVPERAITALQPWPLYDCGVGHDELVETDEKPIWATRATAPLTKESIDAVFAGARPRVSAPA